MTAARSFLINGKYKIAPMIEADLNRVMELEEQSFVTPWSRQSIIGQMKNSFSHIWTIRDVSQTGCAACGFVSYWEVGSIVDLHQICVDPSLRKSGLGFMLLNFLVNLARAGKMEKIRLEVRENNQPAIKLYEKANFKVVGSRPGYYSDTGEDAVLMDLDLSENNSG